MTNMHMREEFKGNDQLIIGNGQGLTITHVGNASLRLSSSKTTYILLKDMLLVPSMTKNLLSISKLTSDNNISVEFCGNVCFVKDKMKGQVLLQGLSEKGLYKLQLKPVHPILMSHICQLFIQISLCLCCLLSIETIRPQINVILLLRLVSNLFHQIVLKQLIN